MNARSKPTATLLTALVFVTACAFDQSGLERVPAGQDPAADAPDAASSADAPGLDQPDAKPSAPDASVETPDSPPGAADAGPPDPDSDLGEVGDVVCGDSLCGSPQVCCVSRAGMSGQVQTECAAHDDCDDSDAVTCDGPEDCPDADEVCCRGSILDDSTVCENASSCLARVCHTQADCPGVADQCCPTEQGVGYCSPLGCL